MQEIITTYLPVFLLAGTLLMGAVCATWIRLIMANITSNRHLVDICTVTDGARPPSGAPKVSVIIPAKNEEENIGRCLTSLACQDYPDYEVIVVDDDSTDMTYEVVYSYTKSSNNIAIHHTKKPDGWVGKAWASSEGAKLANS